jgi:hypothetical protein
MTSEVRMFCGLLMSPCPPRRLPGEGHGGRHEPRRPSSTWRRLWLPEYDDSGNLGLEVAGVSGSRRKMQSTALVIDLMGQQFLVAARDRSSCSRRLGGRRFGLVGDAAKARQVPEPANATSPAALRTGLVLLGWLRGPESTETCKLNP